MVWRIIMGKNNDCFKNYSFSKKDLNMWLFILCIMFLLSRIIFLDSDIPKWDISNYQPIDELYYTTTAFNLYHYHNWQPQVLSFVPSDSSNENLLGNILCFFTLSVFGNNYFGLRMASVLAAFGVFLLMFFILKNYLTRRKVANIHSSSDYVNVIILICLLYLICDFSFLLAGRIMEPTIFRMLTLVMIIYFFSTGFSRKSINARWFVCFAGFFAVVAVFYVYPYNAFIVPAIWFFCFYAALAKGYKEAIVQTCVFLVGAMIGIVSYEVFLRLILDRSIMDAIVSLSIFSDRIAVSSASENIGIIDTIKPYIYNIFGVLSTNIFRFNPILLVIFLGALPIFIYKLIKRNNIRDILLASLLGFYLLQSLFINDYFYRKPVIMLPMVLLLIAISVAIYRDFTEYLRNNYKLLVAYKCYIVLCICCALGIIFINSTEKLVAYNVLSDAISFLLPIFIFQLLLIVTLLTRRKTIPKYLTTIVVLVIIIPNVYLGTKYIYVNPSYSYKNTMIKLSNYIDNEVVAGGMAHGFRLYNTSIPLINPYLYVYTDNGVETYKMLSEKIINEDISQYTILYVAEDKNKNNAFYATNEVYHDKIDLIFEFDLNNTERGEKPNIGLYRYR
jgi:hypothetical protein